MARTGNSSNAYVKTSSTISPLVLWSWHFHYKNSVVPGTGSDSRVFTVSDGSFNVDMGFIWHNSVTPKTAYQKAAGGSYTLVTIPSSLLADTWYRIGASFNGSTLAVYVNGTLVASATASAGPVSANPTPTALAGLAGSGQFDGGTIAEVGLWNAELSSAEFGALGLGCSPLMVKPASLTHYWPLLNDILSLVGGALASANTSLADHPPQVIYPDNAQLMKETDNAYYQVTESGGFTLGESATVQMAYVATESGGFTLAETSIVTLDLTWATSIDFAQAEDSEPYFRHGLALAQAFTLDFVYVTWATSISFRAAFAPDNGYLVSGRNRGIANNSRGIASD